MKQNNEIPKILQFKKNGEFHDYMAKILNGDPFIGAMTDQELCDEYMESIKDEHVAFNTSFEA